MFSIMDMVEALANTYEDLDDYAKEDVIVSELEEWIEEEYLHERI